MDNVHQDDLGPSGGEGLERHIQQGARAKQDEPLPVAREVIQEPLRLRPMQGPRGALSTLTEPPPRVRRTAERRVRVRRTR